MDEVPARLKEYTNEVLRMIGRDLMLFRQIEGMPKFLLANPSARSTHGRRRSLRNW